MSNFSEFSSAITMRQLRIIAALADLKLVARVSESLNVTQPAVSKQIVELERIVGVSIVVRDKNRLSLTAAGLRLAEHAKQVLKQLDRAAFDIEAMAKGVSGTLSIGTVSSVSPTVLPRALALFKGSAPMASVSISEGHFVGFLPELETGNIDLLLARIWQPQELQGISQIPLYSEPIVVVTGPNNRLAEKYEIDWEDIVSSVPWILPQEKSVARGAIDALFAEHGLTPPVNVIGSLSLTLNLELLRTTPAFCFLPQRLAQSYARRGEIVQLPLDTKGVLSEIRCFWRTEKITQNATLSLFLECLVKVAGETKTIPFG